MGDNDSSIGLGVNAPATQPGEDLKDGMDSERLRLILAGAEQLSALADKVAGFAIGSSLLLIFACLKDLAPWVKSRKWWFEGGIFGAGLAYVGAVWFLHLQELDVRNALPASELAGTLAATLNHVSYLLAWSRTGGIIVFTFISMLAVWGTAKGHDDPPH